MSELLQVPGATLVGGDIIHYDEGTRTHTVLAKASPGGLMPTEEGVMLLATLQAPPPKRTRQRAIAATADAFVETDLMEA